MFKTKRFLDLKLLNTREKKEENEIIEKLTPNFINRIMKFGLRINFLKL